jgi:hypothetical protein
VIAASPFLTPLPTCTKSEATGAADLLRAIQLAHITRSFRRRPVRRVTLRDGLQREPR